MQIKYENPADRKRKTFNELTVGALFKFDRPNLRKDLLMKTTEGWVSIDDFENEVGYNSLNKIDNDEVVEFEVVTTLTARVKS